MINPAEYLAEVADELTEVGLKVIHVEEHQGEGSGFIQIAARSGLAPEWPVTDVTWGARDGWAISPETDELPRSDQMRDVPVDADAPAVRVAAEVVKMVLTA